MANGVNMKQARWGARRYGKEQVAESILRASPAEKTTTHGVLGTVRHRLTLKMAQ